MPFFDKVPAANLETSTLDARRKIESIKLEHDESIVSLDVRSLYTNVSGNEALEIASRSMYSSDHALRCQDQLSKQPGCDKCLF